MCKLCVGALRETFPDVPDDEVGSFIMSVTAWPVCDADTVVRRLKELRTKTANYKECYGIVEREMEEAHEAWKISEAPQRVPGLWIEIAAPAIRGFVLRV